MKTVINIGPQLDMATYPCCNGLNWLAKKTFNLVIPDDDVIVAPSFLLMEDDVSYFLLEDGVSRIELE